MQTVHQRVTYYFPASAHLYQNPGRDSMAKCDASARSWRPPRRSVVSDRVPMYNRTWTLGLGCCLRISGCHVSRGKSVVSSEAILVQRGCAACLLQPRRPDLPQSIRRSSDRGRETKQVLVGHATGRMNLAGRSRVAQLRIRTGWEHGAPKDVVDHR